MKILLLFALLSVSAFSLAEKTKSKFNPSRFGLYVGINGSAVSSDQVDAFLGDVDFTVGEVFAGASWRWIGVEVRQGLSLADETINLGTDPETQATSFAESSIESYTSTYLRLQLSNKIGRVYALLGQTEIEANSFIDGETIFGGAARDNSFGIGAGIKVNKYIYFNLEAKRLFDGEDQRFDQLGFGIEFRF